MFAKSSVLAVAAILGLASAQSSSICSNSTINIQSDGDVSLISGCTRLSGDLILGTEVRSITLSGVTQIDGSFRCEGASNLTSLSAPMLESIGNSFTLSRLTRLSSLSMASLTSVGSIAWTTLPNLAQLSFTAGVTGANNVQISDTTLTSLSGITLDNVDMVRIDNNFYLTDITLGVSTVRTSMNIAFNSKQVTLNFPRMIWATNLTFTDCNTITLPLLRTVNGSMGIVNNTFTSFTAPNLTSVGQSIAFVSNANANNISVPLLTTVGGALVVANNTNLKVIDGFPLVKSVGGTVDLTGTFTNASLPALTDVRGGFNLQTTEAFDCSSFQRLQSSGGIKGKGYTCTQTSTPTSGNGVRSGNGTGSGGKKSAAGRVDTAAPLTLGLLAVMSYLFL